MLDTFFALMYLHLVNLSLPIGKPGLEKSYKETREAGGSIEPTIERIQTEGRCDGKTER